jgi:hypothetical protein
MWLAGCDQRSWTFDLAEPFRLRFLFAHRHLKEERFYGGD